MVHFRFFSFVCFKWKVAQLISSLFFREHSKNYIAYYSPTPKNKELLWIWIKFHSLSPKAIKGWGTKESPNTS